MYQQASVVCQIEKGTKQAPNLIEGKKSISIFCDLKMYSHILGVFQNK